MAKEKTKQNKETRRLLNSWTFNLANRLMEEENVSRKVAFRQAKLTLDLLDALGQGIVSFRYTKQDGTLRTARGTLCHGISEAFDNYVYKTDLTEKDYDTQLTFTYWDLDREAFRSFAAMQLEKIDSLTIPNM
jgi:hypothetical protein